METLQQRERRIQHLENRRAKRSRKISWPTSLNTRYRPKLAAAVQSLPRPSLPSAALFRQMRRRLS
jgi:hypothetical protein